jgi:hypothetical protein
VDLRIGVTVTEVRRPAGTGPVTLTLEDGSEVAAHEALLATGRAPLTDDIGLDTVAWSPGPGWRSTTPLPCYLGVVMDHRFGDVAPRAGFKSPLGHDPLPHVLQFDVRISAG